MIYTNKHNLPEPLVSAIKRETYDRKGDISVSELIRAPRQVQLERRHDYEITVDVSEFTWLLLGQAVHAILERADTSNHLAEERMIVDVDGWKLSGKPDLLGPDGTLSDWKVTSVYSFLLGDKPEWEKQLNVYAWMYRQHGFEVKRLQIVAILRDWMSSRAEREPDYPQSGFHVVDVPMWQPLDAQAYVEVALQIHKTFQDVPDDQLQFCGPEQRWERPTTWAVMKPGAKKALRVFDTLSRASDYGAALMSSRNECVQVVERPGESVRCQRFCRALPWCNQAREMGITPKE